MRISLAKLSSLIIITIVVVNVRISSSFLIDFKIFFEKFLILLAYLYHIYCYYNYYIYRPINKQKNYILKFENTFILFYLSI